MVSFRSALFVASVLGAGGTNLHVSFVDCGNSQTNCKVTSVQPTTITTGVNTHLTATGELKHGASGGSFEAKLNAGGGLVKETYTGDVCSGKHFTLPLNLGSLSWDGVSCPIDAGDLTVGMSIQLSKFIPASLATSSISVTMSDNLLCAQIHISPATAEDKVGISAQTVEDKFQQFEAFYGKNFAADERLARLAAFSDNLERIEQLTLWDEGDAVYSHLTPFADISAADFAVRFGVKDAHSMSTSTELLEPPLDVSAAPTSFDWRSKGAVNPVQNQQQCGSCWAFSTVANLEGALFVHSGSLVKLSEQQLVSCSTDQKVNQGCNGGWPSKSYDEMIEENYGLELESSYPYTSGGGDSGVCKHPGAEVGFVSAYKALGTRESDLAAWLVQYGPLSILVNAEPMQTYRNGIMDLSFWACLPQLDHAVAIVAYGVASKEYWTVRNSWSAQWGEGGYIRMRRGTGMCGLNKKAVAATHVSLKEGEVAV